MSKKMCSEYGKGVSGSQKNKFIAQTEDAKYFCEKCARVSNDKSDLCKSKKLKKKDKM